MKAKTWAIGDVHGHHDALMALMKTLEKNGLNKRKDTVILLGDMIDRGPKTKEVINQCIKWKKQYPHWQFLYGNHCDLMLDALMYGGRIYNSYDLWWGQGGKETFLSYVPKGLTKYEKSILNPKEVIPQQHLEWLATLPRWYEDDKYFYVHGGLKPGFHPQDTDPYELIWIRDEFIDSKYDWKKKVIFGHSSDNMGRYNLEGKPFEPIVLPNKIGIETAIIYPERGKLTAVELPAEKFYFQNNLSKI